MGTSRGYIRSRTTITAPGRRQQAGVMLLEVLIAILIFSVGILAVVGMQAAAISNVNDSKYRSEAAFLANRLLSQMWTDAGNISQYNYPLGGSEPAKLNTWIHDNTVGVYKLLPGTVQPIVLVPAGSTTGAQVTVTVRWRTPEEQGQTPQPPAHTYTVVASIYTS